MILLAPILFALIFSFQAYEGCHGATSTQKFGSLARGLSFYCREAQYGDIECIASLLCNNLYREEKTGWLMSKIRNIYRNWDTQQLLSHRITKFEYDEGKNSHKMLVAIATATEMKESEKLIGFIEIGLVKFDYLIPDR